MNASSGVVRDDKQKLDHDGGLEASVGGLFHLKTPSAASGSSVYASSAHRNVSGLSAYLWMARDSWVENLRCPHCRKTGAARVSATDEYSWDIQINSVPEGFKIVGSNFYCASCDRAVEP
jgi:hypothetical protein